MKHPAYPKYKSSGVEWLGNVPEHWEVKRQKTSARCWVSNVDKVPAEDELPVRLCNHPRSVSTSGRARNQIPTSRELKRLRSRVEQVYESNSGGVEV